jgi:CRISPR-associated endonuclease Csn1
LFRKNKRLHDVIFEYLQESYGVPIENKRFLWHPSEQENYHPAKEYYQYNVGAKSCLVAENNRLGFDEKNPNAQFVGISLKLLGSPEPVSKGLKNPMALKTLHKLKHLINYLLKTGKIEEDTRIVVEIARELNDSNRRKAIERWQRQREKENEEFAKIVIEILKPKYPDLNENNPQVINKIRLWFEQIENGDEELKQVIALKNDVKKWRLWNEQKCQCLYTGYPISIADLFNGNKFDIEHTIPASISFDNELKNLTIADSDFNRNIKKNKIPTQLQNYPDIESRLRIFKEKVDHYKELVNDWLVRTRYAKDKESKDRCIQNRHFYQFELEYWRKKLETFTCEEYKQGWRNSQLRDTQIITKYALPYLKTVFKKVEVQKGSVVNDFKEIYSIKFTSEKKNREKHHHHAIDAAILTLIPPFAIRDKILLKFNKAKEQKKTYHELPYKWNRFTPSKILNIENDVLINYMPEYRSVNNTYKKVRKRGKVQYVREKNADGSFRFKKDEYGNKIPIMAKGDTIRGQLHKESFYGAIRKAKRDEDGRIIFDSNNNMVLDELPTIVKRRVLEYKKNEDSEGFKSLDEIEKVIIDRPLFEIIKKQIQEASSFKDAMEIGVWMLDKKGEKVNKIRRIRCGEKVKFESVIKVHKHTNESDKSYKKYIYAMNGENALCLFYEDNINGKIIRSARLISLYEMAQLKITNEQELFDIPLYKKVEVGRGKNKVSIPLTHIFKSGDKVIFYKNCIEELKDLDKSDQLKRLYILYGFEDEWDKKRLNKTKHRISFRNHLIAGTLTDIKKMYGQSSIIDFDNINPLLRLSKNNWNFAIEGKNFDIEIDGTINWRD